MRGIGLISIVVGVALMVLAIPQMDALRDAVAGTTPSGISFMFAFLLVLVVLAIIAAIVYSIAH